MSGGGKLITGSSIPLIIPKCDVVDPKNELRLTLSWTALTVVDLIGIQLKYVDLGDLLRRKKHC